MEYQHPVGFQAFFKRFKKFKKFNFFIDALRENTWRRKITLNFIALSVKIEDFRYICDIEIGFEELSVGFICYWLKIDKLSS